jgi:hypothetical protein
LTQGGVTFASLPADGAAAFYAPGMKAGNEPAPAQAVLSRIQMSSAISAYI